MRLATAKLKSADLPQLVMKDSFVVNYIEKESDASMYTCRLYTASSATKDVTITVMCLDMWLVGKIEIAGSS